jgi:hypothetical protein
VIFRSKVSPLSFLLLFEVSSDLMLIHAFNFFLIFILFLKSSTYILARQLSSSLSLRSKVDIPGRSCFSYLLICWSFVCFSRWLFWCRRINTGENISLAWSFSSWWLIYIYKNLWISKILIGGNRILHLLHLWPKEIV